MSIRTLYLSKLIGLYCIFFGLCMIARKPMLLGAVITLVGNATAVLLLGAFALLAGLAMILGHNFWSGGPLRVVVTLVGWLSLLKGLLVMFLPHRMLVGLVFGGLRYDQLFYFYAAICLVLGVYLTYAGFRTKPE